jgi:four helix bundle protein
MQNEEKDLRDRTKAFAFQIIQMFAGLPKTTQAQVLGKQVLRSGTSVGANYREAYRGRSKAEFIAKCGDSLRELEETAYWLELLVDLLKVAPSCVGFSPDERTGAELRIVDCGLRNRASR